MRNHELYWIAGCVAGLFALGACGQSGTTTTVSGSKPLDLNGIATIGCGLAQAVGDGLKGFNDPKIKTGLEIGRPILDAACKSLIDAGAKVPPTLASTVSATTVPK